MKTTVFNLIILDESGSMSGVTKQTISGCNETINVAKTQAKKNSDALHSLVSVYAFQSGGDRPSRYIIKNKPATEAEMITDKDYDPCGCTPLLDAVGSTMTELKAVAATHEDSTGVITIITDGMENSSSNYTWGDVSRLISQFKEMGWTVNLIGANIDVEDMATRMNIDNKIAFSATSEGTAEMWQEFNSKVDRRMSEYAEDCRCACDPDERIELRKKKSSNFWI